MVMDVERLRDVCQRFGIVRLEVFGSSARGTAGPDSEVAVREALAPGVRLGWEIEDLASELEAVLGRHVDLVSRRALNARIRDQVLQEAQPFYAAA